MAAKPLMSADLGNVVWGDEHISSSKVSMNDVFALQVCHAAARITDKQAKRTLVCWRKVRNMNEIGVVIQWYKNHCWCPNLAKPIWSFNVITVLPRDLRKSTKLPLARNSVTMRIVSPRTTPISWTRFLWRNDLIHTSPMSPQTVMLFLYYVI